MKLAFAPTFATNKPMSSANRGMRYAIGAFGERVIRALPRATPHPHLRNVDAEVCKPLPQGERGKLCAALTLPVHHRDTENTENAWRGAKSSFRALSVSVVNFFRFRARIDQSRSDSGRPKARSQLPHGRLARRSRSRLRILRASWLWLIHSSIHRAASPPLEQPKLQVVQCRP